jgi:hypothetical protein
MSEIRDILSNAEPDFAKVGVIAHLLDKITGNGSPTISGEDHEAVV